MIYPLQTTKSVYFLMTRHENIFISFAFFSTSTSDLVFDAACLFLMAYIYIYIYVYIYIYTYIHVLFPILKFLQSDV